MESNVPSNEPFYLPEELTIHHVDEFVSNLGKELALKDAIVVDASELKNVDACGLQLLIAGAKEAAIKSKSFTVINPPDKLQYILSISGAGKVISIGGEG